MNDKLVNYRQGQITIETLKAINAALHADYNNALLGTIPKNVNVDATRVLNNTPFIDMDGTLKYGTLPIYENLGILLNAGDIYNFQVNYGYYNNCTIYVNAPEPNITNDIHSYGGFNQPVVFGPNVTNISRMFANQNQFNQPVNIPGTVISAGSCFYNCRNFNSAVTVAGSVKYAAGMFFDCNNLNAPITLLDGIETVNQMFYDCRKFRQHVDIPDSVKYLDYMFADSAGGSNIRIPNNAISLSCMFYNSHCYTDLIIPINVNKGIRMLANSDFSRNITFLCDSGEYDSMIENCRYFNSSVTLPPNATGISYIFANCRALNSDIYLPHDATNLNSAYAFYNCLNFNANIYAPQGVDTTGWSQNAIDHIVWY